MVREFFCIFLDEKGVIHKEYFSKNDKHDRTLLFYFPVISWNRDFISLDDLEKLFFYLGQFLSAKLSLKQSVENLDISTLSLKGQKYVKRLLKHIEDGHPFSQFFQNETLIQDQIILSTLLMAEKTGNFDIILMNLSSYIQSKKETIGKIRDMLVYPAMIFSILMLFVFFILPQILVNMIHFISEKEMSLIFRLFLKMHEYSFLLVPVMVIPLILGVIFRNQFLRKFLSIDTEMEHFFYLLSFLLKTKMSFMEAMGILVKEKERFPSIDSSWMYKSLQEGKSLGDVFHGQNRFPKFVGSFLAMSEQTSNLAESTEKIHLILKKMHEKNIKKSMDMMPNILLLIIGGLFLLLIVGIFLPIYDQAIRLVEAG